jgi:hypothetical protein
MHTWFQTSAVCWILCVFFWVSPRRQNLTPGRYPKEYTQSMQWSTEYWRWITAKSGQWNNVAVQIQVDKLGEATILLRQHSIRCATLTFWNSAQQCKFRTQLGYSAVLPTNNMVSLVNGHVRCTIWCSSGAQIPWNRVGRKGHVKSFLRGHRPHSRRFLKTMVQAVCVTATLQITGDTWHRNCRLLWFLPHSTRRTCRHGIE